MNFVNIVTERIVDKVYSSILSLRMYFINIWMKLFKLDLILNNGLDSNALVKNKLILSFVGNTSVDY